MSNLSDLIRLTRPPQWTKNFLLFAALIFSKKMFEPGDVLLVTLGFLLFCIVSSGAYVMNDLRDCDRDREHPTKSRRPLPSGRVTRSSAIVLMIALMVGGVGGAFLLHSGFGILVAAYLALQVAYTIRLKEMVILDVMTIAAGFVIRAGAGGVIIDVPVSPWLIICTFLLALFLGFSKRRHELTLLDSKATEHRASLAEYGTYFLDQMISVVTASTVVAYATYTVSPEVRDKLGTDLLYLTVPFVLFGIFRYLYLVHQRSEGGNPTRVLLTDRPLQLDVLLWIVTVALLLYGGW